MLRRRETLRLCTTVAPAEQPPETDVWGLCEEYDEDMFESMDDDFNRNDDKRESDFSTHLLTLCWIEKSIDTAIFRVGSPEVKTARDNVRGSIIVNVATGHTG